MNGYAKDFKSINFVFKRKKYKQKLLIDMLLQYSKYDLKKLAITLAVPINNLELVYKGQSYLMDEAERCLAEIFLVAFCD